MYTLCPGYILSSTLIPFPECLEDLRDYDNFFCPVYSDHRHVYLTDLINCERTDPICGLA